MKVGKDEEKKKKFDTNVYYNNTKSVSDLQGWMERKP